MIDEDREAIRRVQHGETEAFEVLVEKYKQKAYRLAWQVLRDQEEALDVAQEAFVKAFRALPKFKGDSAFYTWLFRITMNLALDRRRQRATRARSMGGDDVPPEEWERTAVSTDAAPDDEAAFAERRRRIGEALATLSEQHRSIIILSDIEGLAYREIAEVLAIPMGTVMSRLHHARKRLREALGPGFAASLVVLAITAALVAGAAAGAASQDPASPLPSARPSPADPFQPGAQLPPPGQRPADPSPPRAQLPPPGQLPTVVPGVPDQQVCVYALVLLASSPAGAPPVARVAPGPGSGGGRPAPVPGLTPTPDLKAESPAETTVPGGGCGQPVRLMPWVPRLQEVFGYSHYEPISAFETTMPVGMVQRFALPGGREMELQPLAVRIPVVRVLVRIKRGGVPELATVMDVPARRPALIGGPPHGPGVLIIAIRARAH